MHSFLRFLWLGCVTLAVASCTTLSNTPPSPVVSPTDRRFLFEGRFDFANPEEPAVIWQGSRIRLDFEGENLTLRFSEIKGQNFFDAQIDGRNTLVGLRENAPPRDITFSGLGVGRHSLVLFKRSEAAAGTARFRGVELAPHARAFAPTRPIYKVAFQFFGDSITAGACNEDGATDQWEDRRTHNSAQSYAALVAKAFAADHRNIAVSGMGISTGWVAPRAAEIWDRVYPEVNSPRADLITWTPQVIFVNLGENDDSFTKAKSLPFPADYTDRYVEFVQEIRRAYPRAEIVLLRGGMFGGARSERLHGPWESAVRKLQSADAQVHRFVFQHWSSLHPRVSDHQIMADELIAWLRQQSFLAFAAEDATRGTR